MKSLKLKDTFFSLRYKLSVFTFQFIMISINILINHLIMIVTKHKCFKDKLKLWEKVLSTLINLPVNKRCYNLVGSKIVKSNEFIEAIRKECSYEDAKCSTLVEHLTKTILPLGVLLAEAYETSDLLLPTILLLVPNSRVATVLISFILKEKLGQIQIPITMYDRTSEQPFYCYADTYYYFRRKQIL